MFTEVKVTEEHDGCYFIGCASVSGSFLLFENSVSPQDYFRHSGAETLDYLVETSTVVPTWHQLEIIKLQCIPYKRWVLWTCVFKTHYLRLIQRRWRNVLKKRQECVTSAAFMRQLRRRELGYPLSIKVPGLRGMLCP
jgi:hypothetical protein